MLCARTVLSMVTNLSRPGVPSVDVNLEMFLLSTVRQVSDFLHSRSFVFSHGLLGTKLLIPFEVYILLCLKLSSQEYANPRLPLSSASFSIDTFGLPSTGKDNGLSGRLCFS